MKLNYTHKDDSSWFGDLLYFNIETRGKEDGLMDIFIKEIKLNMKHQFEWEFNSVEEVSPKT